MPRSITRDSSGSDTDNNARPDHPLPLVLFVHGGPWARDNWGYNPYHQWLANRGYDPVYGARPLKRAIQRQIEIGIVQHYLSVLPSHLEREPLVHASAGLANDASRFGRPGEGDHRN